ncbi:MAG: hypothetical protein FWG19_00440 [Methanomassiliicoccaceae archaeon]|nr:hypothetical protein [Methanomassiliicoccaceae archaeon]
MNYAVIDLGSNTIHLLIFDVDDNGDISKVLSEKEVAGLAGHVENGVLSDEGIRKACDILNKLKIIAFGFADPVNVRVFATASLRNITNRNEAVRIITEETSLMPDILEGSDEALLGFAGASQTVDMDDGLMVDIGGASTELVKFNKGKAENQASMPVGCLSLYMNCVRESVPEAHERAIIEHIVIEELLRIDWVADKKCKKLVGIGGTVRALLKISRELNLVKDDSNEMEASHVKDILKMMRNHEDNDIYHTIYKTVPERALTIFPGLMILSTVIKQFGCETITVSGSGIRDGYLIRRVLKRDD